MGEEREQVASDEREAARDEEVEGHSLDPSNLDPGAASSGDDVEGHSLDPGNLDPGNVRAE